MIGIIYSYRRSAAAFSTMAAISATGIVLVCLYTQATVDLVLRLVGLGLLLVASYVVTFAYAMRLVYAEIERIGYRNCALDEIGTRLRKLSRRALLGSVRGSLLIETAYTELCRGLYREALQTTSDAIVAGGNGQKGDAAVNFCKIYYMLGDRYYFDHYYETAIAALQRRGNAKNVTDRNIAAAMLTAIEAMRAAMNGDNIAALSKTDGFSLEIPALQQRNLAALHERIATQISAE